jgi:hypothetical protein
LFSIKNLVNKASEYKKGQTTKEAVEKKLDELSLTDEQKREMLVLFEQFAHSQRYIDVMNKVLVIPSPQKKNDLTKYNGWMLLYLVERSERVVI